MVKRSICLFLAILLSVGICACSVKTAEPADTTVSTASAQSITAPAGESETAAQTTTQKEKGAKTTGTTADTTAQKKTSTKKKSSQGSAPNQKEKKKTAQKQTTTSQKQTTKQTTTRAEKSECVSFTINCSQAVGKVSGVPDSGYYLKAAQVSITAEDNVYTVLCRICKQKDISVTASKTMYGMYVSAIGSLAEFDVGKMSGWTYTVNGKYPPKACDKQAVQEGDSIEFIYKAG